MGDKRGWMLADSILLVVVCVLFVLIFAYNRTAEEKRNFGSEEMFCPSILREIEKARAAKEPIPLEAVETAAKCREYGYR